MSPNDVTERCHQTISPNDDNAPPVVVPNIIAWHRIEERQLFPLPSVYGEICVVITELSLFWTWSAQLKKIPVKTLLGKYRRLFWFLEVFAGIYDCAWNSNSPKNNK